MKKNILIISAVFLLVSDYSSGQTKKLNLTALIEGRYYNVVNTMVGDDVKVYLRDGVFPYSVIDSCFSFLDRDGFGEFFFASASNNTPYYLVVKHKNSIETWSKTPQIFTADVLSYDFTSSANKAFGDNLVLKGYKWCVYSGDINQDGLIDVNDVSLVDADKNNLVRGQVITDLNADFAIDIADLMIVFNNSVNYVSALKPSNLLTVINERDQFSGITTVYPNPTSDVLNFTINEIGETIESTTIVDMLGKSISPIYVNSSNQHQVILDHSVPANTYILQVKTNKSVYLKKFAVIR